MVDLEYTRRCHDYTRSVVDVEHCLWLTIHRENRETQFN